HDVTGDGELDELAFAAAQVLADAAPAITDDKGTGLVVALDYDGFARPIMPRAEAALGDEDAYALVLIRAHEWDPRIQQIICRHRSHPIRSSRISSPLEQPVIILAVAKILHFTQALS